MASLRFGTEGDMGCADRLHEESRSARGAVRAVTDTVLISDDSFDPMRPRLSSKGNARCSFGATTFTEKKKTAFQARPTAAPALTRIDGWFQGQRGWQLHVWGSLTANHRTGEQATSGKQRIKEPVFLLSYPEIGVKEPWGTGSISFCGRHAARFDRGIFSQNVVVKSKPKSAIFYSIYRPERVMLGGAADRETGIVSIPLPGSISLKPCTRIYRRHTVQAEYSNVRASRVRRRSSPPHLGRSRSHRRSIVSQWGRGKKKVAPAAALARRRGKKGDGLGAVLPYGQGNVAVLGESPCSAGFGRTLSGHMAGLERRASAGAGGASATRMTNPIC